jgi:hypothetical protein
MIVRTPLLLIVVSEDANQSDLLLFPDLSGLPTVIIVKPNSIFKQVLSTVSLLKENQVFEWFV